MISAAPNQKRHGAAPRPALYNNAVTLAKQESRGRDLVALTPQAPDDLSR
jgi:hypothetical protein